MNKLTLLALLGAVDASGSPTCSTSIQNTTTAIIIKKITTSSTNLMTAKSQKMMSSRTTRSSDKSCKSLTFNPLEVCITSNTIQSLKSASVIGLSQSGKTSGTLANNSMKTNIRSPPIK